MKRALLAVVLAFPLSALAQTVFVQIDGSGNVVGYARNAPSGALNIAVDESDQRVQAYLNGTTPILAAAARSTSIRAAYLSQLSQGLVLTSASAPSLNGTYAVAVPNVSDVNTAAQANITSVETSIAAGRGLPGGGSTFNYFDVLGAAHAFTAEQWGAFATAMMNYSYALQNAYLSAVNSGSAFVAPSNNVVL